MHDKIQIFISQISGQTTKEKKKKRLVASSAQKLNTQASQELNIMSRNKLENKHLLKNWQMS